MQFSNCIADYLSYCEFQKKLNRKTLKAYAIDLHQYEQFSTQAGMAGSLFEKMMISRYITELHKSYRPKTVKRKIACLKAFFSFLEYEEIIAQTPFAKMKVKFHEPFVLPRTIPLQTIQAILHTAYQGLKEKLTSKQLITIKRNIAVLELLFATGMRVSELCSLLRKDVDLQNKQVRIMGKGSKERIIQIGNQDVLNALTQYNQIAILESESAYFFINRLNNRLSEQSVRFMINKYVSISNIPTHITPHMFRHSFASLLLEEDVDIRYIQKFLGHSSIVTTQIYTHVTSNKQRDILTAKNPRNRITLNEG